MFIMLNFLDAQKNIFKSKSRAFLGPSSAKLYRLKRKIDANKYVCSFDMTKLAF